MHSSSPFPSFSVPLAKRVVSPLTYYLSARVADRENRTVALRRLRKVILENIRNHRELLTDEFFDPTGSDMG